MMKTNHLLAALAVLLLAACSPAPQPGRPRMAVTIEPLRYFAGQIAGNRYDITTLVPAGSNPETYEPTPRQMVQLAEAALYIKVGQIGFERTWMQKLQQNAPRMQVVDASEGITLLHSASGIADPHTWMSCANARTMARNIYRAVAKLQPADSLYFKNNLNRLLCRIDQTDDSIRHLLPTGEHSRPVTFVIYHPILTYYAHEYGLRQLPLEHEGRETSARQLQQIIATAKAQGVRTVFVQRQFNVHNALGAVKAIGARTAEINPLSADWPAQMVHIARVLAQETK